MASAQLTHRQRLEKCLADFPLDRSPVALWRHFPVDDQSATSLAEAVLDFQRSYDFDFVKVTPSSSFAVKDWGSQDEWRGSTEGTRDYTRRVIRQPEDWERLPVLNPMKGFLGEQLKALKIIVRELGPETPVIQTIFNPLSQAKNLVGGAELVIHLRRFPEAVHAGLTTILKTTQQFIEACVETGISGIFYAVQHAQFGLLSLQEYETFGRGYDLQLLEPARDLWLNVLHLHGEQVMFEHFIDYPVAVINWHDRETPPSLATGQKLFAGTVCGGLRRWEGMVLSSPEQVFAEARQAIQTTAGRRFILGTGCVLPIIAPRANILAARLSVESDARS